MPFRAELLNVENVTHNVRRYTLARPAGYTFEPGQATEVAIDRNGWREQKRPFTFTSLPSWEHLEFTIKSYRERPGVTNELWTLKPGDALLLNDVWGTITYNGSGTFIAGGAGVTPFLSILRHLRSQDRLAGHRLIASNRTREDIILREEFEAMRGLETLWTVTRDPEAPGVLHQRIDDGFLRRHVNDFGQKFYLCGPDKMVGQLRTVLTGLGADIASLTWEK